MKTRNIICIIILLLFTFSLQAGIRKSNLKILYVGGSPDIEQTVSRPDSAVLAQSVVQRMGAFEKMLKRYFKQVRVIDAKDYRPALSEDYDVTVMDGKPRPILPAEEYNYNPGYLPENFDRPMLFIAEMGALLGKRIGLKHDWFCHCLDADAHHLRMEHPIFHGPFPVKMTIQQKPTPEDGKAYPYFAGGPTPDSIPMWRVQKEGYKSKKGMRIGMIARPGGYEDSPEAEFISGGVSAKTLDAVAIGRHGNFLHWGFAASPADMTEEAQNVFANAIVYIAGFAGQTPIARKYNDRIITRHDIGLMAFAATRRHYEQGIALDENFSRRMLEVQPKAKEKQARGEKLDLEEEISLNFRPQKQLSYEEELQERFPELYEMFGTDEEGYADYFKDNSPYFRPKEIGYGFVIDEDVRSLGIANNDIRLLDKAISLWESGERVGKARRILTRYTLCRFATPAEWRAWFEANKSRLFFTEAGGWLFMVNTRDTTVPGNDYSLRQVPIAAAPSVTATAATARTGILPAPAGLPETAATDDRNPVRIAAAIEPLPNGNRQVTVRMKIHKGYHIYGRVADSDPFIATTVEFRPASGVTCVGETKKPSAKIYNKAGTTVYENEAVFRQEVSGTGGVTCIVGWQCCNETICMPPTEVELQAE